MAASLHHDFSAFGRAAREIAMGQRHAESGTRDVSPIDRVKKWVRDTASSTCVVVLNNCQFEIAGTEGVRTPSETGISVRHI